MRGRQCWQQLTKPGAALAAAASAQSGSAASLPCKQPLLLPLNPSQPLTVQQTQCSMQPLRFVLLPPLALPLLPPLIASSKLRSALSSRPW